MIIRQITSMTHFPIDVILVSSSFPFVNIFISDSQATSKAKVSFIASKLADTAP